MNWNEYGCPECDHPSSRHSENFGQSPIITIIVGKERVKYTVHKDVLIAKCPFFAKCLTSGMKEAMSNEVELPGECVNAFEGFMCWTYTGRVRDVFEESFEEGMIRTMKEWILAEKFCMPRWQNELLDEMAYWIRDRGAIVVPDVISWALDNVSQPSLLLDFFVDLFAKDIQSGDVALTELDEENLMENPRFPATRLLRAVIEAGTASSSGRFCSPYDLFHKYHVSP